MEVIPCSLQLFALADMMIDISGWTVVFSGKSLSTIRERIFKFVGVPEVEPLVRSDGRALDEGLPTHLVKAIVWDSWVEEDHEDLRIIDFGRSFFQWEKNGKAAKPRPLPAPETIFTGSFDYRVDLWRAGCVVSDPASTLNAILIFIDILVRFWGKPLYI